jgi:hypothetical protein
MHSTPAEASLPIIRATTTDGDQKKTWRATPPSWDASRCLPR